ncbi:hypothetical protein ON010_g13625 [Phytophthora cinnamomi]|nr:hypothetical protein ON010_g13625 [Phytophthora cinnamomi]
MAFQCSASAAACSTRAAPCAPTPTRTAKSSASTAQSARPSRSFRQTHVPIQPSSPWSIHSRLLLCMKQQPHVPNRCDPALTWPLTRIPASRTLVTPKDTLQRLGAVHRLPNSPPGRHAPVISMLKLRVVLSFAVAALVTLTSLDNAAAQAVGQASQADNEPSYTGSGDASVAGETAEPVVEEPPSEYDYTPSPTEPAPTTSSSGSDYSADIVPRWGPCDDNVRCHKHTYCKLLSSGISICYPA